jgi:hypothetical protein
MIWPQLIFSAVLLVIGSVMIAFNVMVFWCTVIRKEHAPSVLPIFGGVIAAAGIATLPLPESWKWAWMPLVADWGGLPIFLTALLSGSSK